VADFMKHAYKAAISSILTLKLNDGMMARIVKAKSAARPKKWCKFEVSASDLS